MASNTVQEATQVETNEVGVECERGNDDPLRVIYKCLANPATSTHALMGVETAEVFTFNDFRFNPSYYPRRIYSFF